MSTRVGSAKTRVGTSAPGEPQNFDRIFNRNSVRFNPILALSMSRKAQPLVDLAVEVSLSQMAGFLQTTPQQLLKLTHRGKLSVFKDAQGVPVAGKYQLNKATAEYLAWLQGNREGKSLSAFDDARARRALAAAEVSKMRVARMSGALVDSAAALEAVDKMILRLRSKLTAAIPRLAREIYRAANEQAALESAETLIGEALLELRKLQPDELVPAKLAVVRRDQADYEEADDKG
jgi:hypothetical protein